MTSRSASTMTPLHQAILATLAYTDQFGFPLLESELWQRLIWASADHGPKPTRAAFKTALTQLNKQRHIVKEWHYWCLAGSEATVPTRRQRGHWAAEKWYLAEEIAAATAHIPWIKAIAVTGAMAMANPSTPDDDLDVMIITQPRRLWLSRLWLSLMAWHHGRRRSWHGAEKNTWCLNLWLDSDNLQIHHSRQSLYTAYEVVQARWVRDYSGEQAAFYLQNQWVRQWLPNAELRVHGVGRRRKRPFWQQLPGSGGVAAVLFVLADGADALAYSLQRWYMRAHHTREVVGRGVAFFHPRDTRQLVEGRWQRQLKRLVVSPSDR